MLASYDYEGLKHVSKNEKIIALAKNALKLYNFEEIQGVSMENPSFELKSSEGIPQLFYNLRICYIQGRYADVVGRLVRLEEAIGRYLMYCEFRENEDAQGRIRIRYNGRKTRKWTFEKIINHHEKHHLNYALFTNFEAVFKPVYDDKKELTKLYFSQFSTKTTSYEKAIWYYLCKSLGTANNFVILFEKLNNFYKKGGKSIGNLRNKSILGHGLDGVSKEDIQEVTNGFEEFMSNLEHLLEDELTFNMTDPFDDINQDIKLLIQKG